MNLYQSLIQKLGVTDEVNTCSCCGKTGLKRTVVFEVNEESEYYNASHVPGFVFLGSTCATNTKAKGSQGKISAKELPGSIEMSNGEGEKLATKIVFTGSDVRLTYADGDFWSLLGNRGKLQYTAMIQNGCGFTGSIENNLRVWNAIKSWAERTRNTEALSYLLN